MKSIFLIFLCLFLVSGSNNLVKCFSCSKYLEEHCVVCDKTPCECKELTSQNNNCKVSIKKLIILFLKKANFKCSDEQECTYCRQPCPKKQGIAKLLVDIMKKTCTSEEEEESIREIIVNLLDPSECTKNPCQFHCDPEVQKVLKAILKKAAGCYCQDCPSNCIGNPPHCGQEKYKYWFKASKEVQSKDISHEFKPQPECRVLKIDCQEKKKKQNTFCQDVRPLKKCNKNRKFYKYGFKIWENCKTCQRPNNLICPRDVTDDCLNRSKTNFFSICADCNRCLIFSNDKKKYVGVIGKECKPVNSPFVQFTRNGYPLRRVSEEHVGIQVKTKFLQINDFKSGQAKSLTGVFNPFHTKCNIPQKKSGGNATKKKYKRKSLINS